MILVSTLEPYLSREIYLRESLSNLQLISIKVQIPYCVEVVLSPLKWSVAMITLCV